jgi:hypothetical protein
MARPVLQRYFDSIFIYLNITTMKLIQLSLIFTICFLASCNNQSTETPAIPATSDSSSADTSQVVENKIMVPNVKCYSYQKGKDTVSLKTEHFPNVVAGILLYNFSGKDSNKGEIDGVLHGDTLVADYKFTSEGKLSIRQVAFLLKDSIATEGYGPVEEKDGKMVFKNISTLDFSKGIKLKQVPCPAE